jgi:5'-3' exonuclease
MLIRITSEYFCAGIIYYKTKDNICAPIIKYMEKWSLKKIKRYCNNKGYNYKIIKSKKRRKIMKKKSHILIIDGNLFARKMFYKFKYLKTKTSISELAKYSPGIVVDAFPDKNKKIKLNKTQIKFNESNGESKKYLEMNDTDKRINEIITHQKDITIMTGIIYGMLRSLINVYRTFSIKYTVICYDPGKILSKEKGRTDFRSSIDNTYKASRESKDSTEFYNQLKIAQHILFLLGIEQSWTSSFEADDLLQFYSKIVFKKNKCLLLTSDHDLFQCISNKDSILLIGNNSKIYTKNNFIEDYGISPSKYRDVMSISGCRGDEVNGIVGIGETKAIEAIKEFGSLKNLKKEFGNGQDNLSKGTKALLRVEKEDNNYETIKLTRKLISLYGNKPGF